ncbi:MAG TPA: hypothetical protein VEB87_04980 [Nitrososphaerales archaeon]|nr:hypothetical protein [Nitrososphaerales archaeon]
MYAFKDSVYLVIGIIFVLFGSFLIEIGIWWGFLVVCVGIVMSTFAAYQMGQSSQRVGSRPP